METMKDWLHGRRVRLPQVSLRKAGPVAGSHGRGPAPEAKPAGTGGDTQGEWVLFVALDGGMWGRVVQGLAAASYRVSYARGVEPALDTLAGARPSLVIVGGPADAAAYRVLAAATGAPILALLVGGGEAGMLSALAAGADDCQPATLNTGELLCRARSLLRRGV